MKRVGIVGLGLLGGSIAKALQGSKTYDVIGYARRPEVCGEALESGAVVAAYTDVDTVIQESDIVVFALPPDTNCRVFLDHVHCFRPGTLITDVSSTKGNFVPTVYENLPEGVHFVSIHPMAGSERGGFSMASADLFNRCSWIVLEDTTAPGWSEEGAVELADMGLSFGARVERIPYAQHDELLAVVSHMPHLVAGMVATLAGGDELGDLRLRLAAGGFRDVTRVAGGNPGMWREILTGNRKAIAASLTALEAEIENVKQRLLADDGGEQLEQYLRRSKEIRDAFSKI